MRTLGIDLASKPANTSACVIEWSDGAATVEVARGGLDDQELLRLSREAHVVGIDAPLGWPDPFVHALVAHHDNAAWPTPWTPAAYRRLCLRRTDDFVIDTAGVRPLSVAADRIAVVAMRAAWLLTQLGVRDRAGDRVVEVYPGAALAVWGLREKKKSYKGKKGREHLPALLERLCRACPSLKFSDGAPKSTFENEHHFDGLIASLNARAAALGLAHRPPSTDAELARKEGWIALPLPGTLERLCAE